LILPPLSIRCDCPVTKPRLIDHQQDVGYDGTLC
jgi:hypothetical protein